MKKIKLSTGHYTLVDDVDFERLSQYRWQLHSGGYAFRAAYIPASKSITGKKRRKTVYMHRLIMDNPENKMIDHINKDKLDNRRTNLRVVTASQNQMNSRRRQASGFKGVYYVKERNIYRVILGFKHKAKTVGWFKNKIEAAKAYNSAALELYGEYAELNDVASR